MEIHFRLNYRITQIIYFLISPLYWLYSLTYTEALPAIKNKDILLESATSLAKKIRNKQISCVNVVEAFIQRCKQVNPLVNAIVEDRYSEALQDAKNIDRFLATTDKSLSTIESETPLLGVPFTVKESCGVEGMSYCVGSKARLGNKASHDGIAVATFKKSGGILLAVTNTAEMCTSYETTNRITGFTANPFDLHRTCGGSSGGEAAIISSAGSVIGIASDLGGSVRLPAHFTGIFGHKPTPGIISMYGHFPYLSSYDFLEYFTIGAMCRYAEDLQTTLCALAGKNATKFNFEKQVEFNKLRIYYVEQVSTSYTSVSPEIKNEIRKASLYMNKKYACPLEKLHVNELKDSYEMSMGLLTTVDGAKTFLSFENKITNWIREIVKSFIGLSDYSAEYMIFRFLVSTKCFMSDSKRSHYINMRNKLRQKLSDILKDNGVLFYPTFSEPAFYKKQQWFKISGAMYLAIFSILGFPATHVPMGLNSNNLPVGFQIVAAPMQDRLCIAVAKELEKEFGGWVAPPTKS